MAHVRGDSITVTAAWETLGEAEVSRSAAVALAAADSRLATTHKSDKNSQPSSEPAHTRVCFHPLALSRQAVAVGPRHVFDSGRRAFAAVAAQQGVIAEGLGLTGLAGRLHRLGGADALPRHLVAQATAALARCGRGERGGM